MARQHSKKQGKKTLKPAPRGAAQTRRLMREMSIWKIKKLQKRMARQHSKKLQTLDNASKIVNRYNGRENQLDLLDSTDIEVSYNILSYLPSMYVLALASTSKSMFNLILLDDNILKQEFAQKLYLDRWMTILPRKIGLTLGGYSFPGDTDEDISHLTFNERCSMKMNLNVIYKTSQRDIQHISLNCTQLPAFFKEDFESKLAYSHCDVCNEYYCDCGMARGMFAEREELACECMLCLGLSQERPEEIAVLKTIKEHGCPYCGKTFALGDVEFSIGLDSKCDICNSYHQAGIRANHRCMGCIDNTDNWINYCESCWETVNRKTRDYGVDLEKSHDDIKIAFNEPAKEIFVKQGNLMTLFQKDRQFFALNNWFMFANELINYIRRLTYKETLSFKDFVSSEQEWISLEYPEERSEEECFEEEYLPKKPLLSEFIEARLASIAV